MTAKQDPKDALIRAAARLEGHKREIGKAKGAILEKAAQQLDSMPDAIGCVERHMAAGIGGGIFGHRRHLTMLDEQKRLQRVLADNQEDESSE